MYGAWFSAGVTIEMRGSSATSAGAVDPAADRGGELGRLGGALVGSRVDVLAPGRAVLRHEQDVCLGERAVERATGEIADVVDDEPASRIVRTSSSNGVPS